MKDKIKKDLQALGINPGDCVFCHSSLKSIRPPTDSGQGKTNSTPDASACGPDTVIDALLEALGETGTLALPALCKYDTKNIPMDVIEKNWDIKAQPTFTGIIPETFRLRPGVLRSDNSTHSVTALGPMAEFISADHKNAYIGEYAEKTVDRPGWLSRGAFGPGSPWDKLYQLDAKYMFIGVDFNVCTMFHHVQVLLLTEAGRSGAQWPKFNFLELGRELESAGLVHAGFIGAAQSKWISTKLLVDNAMRILGRH